MKVWFRNLRLKTIRERCSKIHKSAVRLTCTGGVTSGVYWQNRLITIQATKNSRSAFVFVFFRSSLQVQTIQLSQSTISKSHMNFSYLLHRINEWFLKINTVFPHV